METLKSAWAWFIAWPPSVMQVVAWVGAGLLVLAILK